MKIVIFLTYPVILISMIMELLDRSDQTKEPKKSEFSSLIILKVTIRAIFSLFL